MIVGLLCPVLRGGRPGSGCDGMDRSIDVRDRDIGLLQAVAMLNALPLPAIEQLARGLEPVECPPATPWSTRATSATATS